MFTRDGLPVAGGMGEMGQLKANDSWKGYHASPNVSSLVTAGEARGATFFASPMPVADLGVQAVFDDPFGAARGAWQPINFPRFLTLDEHGVPCWFAPNARDFDGAVDIYSSVFSLETHVMADSENFRYTTLVPEGNEVAGCSTHCSISQRASPHTGSSIGT